MSHRCSMCRLAAALEPGYADPAVADVRRVFVAMYRCGRRLGGRRATKEMIITVYCTYVSSLWLRTAASARTC